MSVQTDVTSDAGVTWALDEDQTPDPRAAV